MFSLFAHAHHQFAHILLAHVCKWQRVAANAVGIYCPGDVASLEPHKFKGLLETLEHGIAYVLIFVYFS